MASFNKIMIVGYLGRDPEIRYTPQGTPVCNFSIATTEKRKSRSGEAQDVTTWFRVSAWGRQAEIANEYLKKGRQVFVEGRLRQEEYTDKDGNRRQSLEVTATDVNFLGTRGEVVKVEVTAESDQPAESKTEAAPAKTAGKAPESKPAKTPGKGKTSTSNKELLSIEEDDIPF